MKIENMLNTLAIGLVMGFMVVCIQRVRELEQAVRTYEERQLALISQDKAIRQELADLKRYIQSGEASGG